MKLKTFLPVALGMCLLAGFTACSDNDDSDLDPSKVPQKVTASFNDMFPNARSIEWDRISPWYVADFDENNLDKDAWFTDEGVWVMTETDYGSITTFLPAEVQNAFSQSAYATWTVNDVDKYERIADTFYVIEVESIGFDDVALFYNPDGTLINQIQADYPEITPNTVVNAL